MSIVYFIIKNNKDLYSIKLCTYLVKVIDIIIILTIYLQPMNYKHLSLEFIRLFFKEYFLI